MTRTQKAAVKEYLKRTGLGTTFRVKPPTGPEFMVRNEALLGSCSGDTSKWTSADYEAVENLNLRRPSALQRYGRWLHTHTIGALIRWENAAAQDPATAGVFVLGVALPVALLVLTLSGLVLTVI
ncbi:hypothetical protein [Streptomyces sp. H27-C3]|uniref:hypothetical protein n=1 Tax=Streptomyces sp. H27-C3 TaxID=3046305 RepID=UPI0024B8BBDE|nr:hypothetical protein [Streptomyces sp. H27-C3]MDJ0465033.1 hypothetical protein [Streptomyces sp. H27-C3]